MGIFMRPSIGVRLKRPLALRGYSHEITVVPRVIEAILTQFWDFSSAASQLHIAKSQFAQTKHEQKSER
jgi:hypothetical protein